MAKVVNLHGDPNFSAVSLFSGAMGLDLGLMQAGINVSVAQDHDRWCAETIRKNGHKVIEGDICELIRHDPSCSFLLQEAGLNAADIFAVVGGPPCQAFSTAGKRKGTDDARGALYEQFIHVVKTLRPRFFVMENVKGLLSMPSMSGVPDSEPLLSIIVEEFRALGYHVVFELLDAVHFGVPQFRERLIIVGSRDQEAIFIPSPTHFHQHQEPDMRWRTLGDAIKDRPGDPGLCAKFSSTAAAYLAKVPEGGNWRSLPLTSQKAAMGGAFESGGGKVGFYRRLSFSEPSPTLVTSPVQKATMLCHPIESRPLSVKEYAAIQQFPDDWKIEGSAVQCYKQIGNAVPVGLGRAIGKMLMSVALGNSQIRVRRMRGTSVHNRLKKASAGITWGQTDD